MRAHQTSTGLSSVEYRFSASNLTLDKNIRRVIKAANSGEQLLLPRMRSELFKRLMQRLVPLQRFGELRLLDVDDEWFRMQRQRAAMLRERSALEMMRLQQISILKASISSECVLRRLSLYRKIFAFQRVDRELKEARSRVPEWAGMLREDRVSGAFRPYLTCEAWKLNEIHAVFSQFDDDKSGLVSIDEFRICFFEFGIATSTSSLAKFLRKLTWTEAAR